MSDLIRTKRDGCWQVRSNSWGAFLMPVDDPLATASLEDGAKEQFELNDGITPIPSELWARWIRLCFHFVGSVRNEVEVSCRLLRREDDKSQWRILVPAQDVDGASVRVDSFDHAVDIATGEVIAQYPPTGWVPCGSSHSHNTMRAFFSGTDDRYELGDPGLHIVVGDINTTASTYVPLASITANKRRFLLDDAAAVIDLTARPELSFHPAVLTVIHHERPLAMPMPLPRKQQGRQPLWPHPNQGNGYSGSRLEREDELFWRQQDQFSSPASEPLIHALEQQIDALLTTGQDDAISSLLWDLEDVIAGYRESLFNFEESWNDPDPTNRTATAHPSPAQGLPDGEW